MTAGLPGTGIGGLFYLIGALLMPFRELWRAVFGGTRDHQRQMAIQQGGLAVVILAAVSATGLLLGLLHIGARVARHATALEVHALYIIPIVVAFTTLSTLLIAVEVARIVMLIRDRGIWPIRRSSRSTEHASSRQCTTR